jgi:hypothetical protein
MSADNAGVFAPTLLLKELRVSVYWPFPVMGPWGIPASEPELHEGDYVIITGALVEDSGHLHVDDWTKATSANWSDKCWDEHYRGHGGWLEIHPLNALRRVTAPLVRKHSQVVQVCYGDPYKTPFIFDGYLTPVPSDPPPGYSLRYREIIDNRFTDMSKVLVHLVEINPQEPAKLHVKVDTHETFKAVYLLWWEEGSPPRPTPVSNVQTLTFASAVTPEPRAGRLQAYTVTVTNAATGAPVPQATVTLHNFDNSGNKLTNTATTTANGKVVFNVVLKRKTIVVTGQGPGAPLHESQSVSPTLTIQKIGYNTRNVTLPED